MRLYEMFIGDFEKAAPWSSASIKGCKRFLEKVWALTDILVGGNNYRTELESAFHRTIKKVTEDIEGLKMNTAIATLMSLLNDILSTKQITRKEFETFLILLNPFAPHITEELWEICEYDGMLNEAKWPEYDEAKCVDSSVEIVAQINGKIKARLTIPADTTSEKALSIVKAEAAIAKELEGKTIIKELYVPKKLVNIVVK